MPPTILRAAALRPRPWPNGLGITRDVATAGQGEAGFGWLVSIADLTGDAAFSHFPGCDRVFTLIEGAGVILTLRDHGPLPCLPWVPACFPGDHPTHCTMPGTAARAFNLFLDRASVTGQVSVRSLVASQTARSSASAVAIHCAAGALEIDGQSLSAGDTLLHPGATTLRATQTAMVIIVELMPVAGG